MTKNPWDVLKQWANVTVDVPIGSNCHCGRFDLGRFVKAPMMTGCPCLEKYSRPVKKNIKGKKCLIIFPKCFVVLFS